MRKLILVAASLMTLTAAPSAGAVDYSLWPMLFSYQAKSGSWFGCGPRMCLTVGEKTEAEAIKWLARKTHGNFIFVGRYGRCKVYESDLSHLVRNPKWDMRRIIWEMDLKARC